MSVEITLKPNGDFASVIYRSADGTTYDRGKQYDATSGEYVKGWHYWRGTLRANPNVEMIGSFFPKGGDRLVYLETIHDKRQGGKMVAQVTSTCEPAVAEATPPQSPAAPSPPVSFPKPEFKALLDCVDVAAVALATTSSEPAETIADAALGECRRERATFEEALERQGVKGYIGFADQLAKDMRPDLLALVLNTRIAARSSGGPPQNEPHKDQPL